MGGFVITIEDKSKWILENDGATITPQGIQELTILGKIPTVQRETITGRSKADDVAKTLVCFQAGWMAIQAIARKASGISVTLLELNTLAHVGCGIMMYTIWWTKPQDAAEPVKLPLDPIFVISMCSHSLLSHFKYLPTNRQDAEDDVLILDTDNDQADRLDGSIATVRTDGTMPSILPPNTSGLAVVGNVDLDQWTSWSVEWRLDEARRADGVVMLLAGQSLDGIPFSPRSLPQHLNQQSIKRL
jgi:hypothetical protein